MLFTGSSTVWINGTQTTFTAPLSGGIYNLTLN